MDVKTLCLGVLTFGEHTGYEIKKHFEASFSHFFAAGYGSIYPALAKLTEQGLVSCTDVEQDKKPDKKVYALTVAGRAALIGELSSTYPNHKIRSVFFVLLYFAKLLSDSDLTRVLAQRGEDLQAGLRTVSEFNDCAEPAHEFLLGMARASLQAQLDYLTANKDAFLALSATAAPVA